MTIDPAHLERLCSCPRCNGGDIDDRADRPAYCLLLDYKTQKAIANRQWKSLLQALRREHGKDWRYFRAQEFHAGKLDRNRRVRNHRLHWHVLLELDLGGGFKQPQEGQTAYNTALDRFAALAHRFHYGLTLAYSIDSTDACVRSYVAKYTSKQQPVTEGNHPRRFKTRMVSCSRAIQHPQADPEPCLAFAVVPHEPGFTNPRNEIALALRTLAATPDESETGHSQRVADIGRMLSGAGGFTDWHRPACPAYFSALHDWRLLRRETHRLDHPGNDGSAVANTNRRHSAQKQNVGIIRYRFGTLDPDQQRFTCSVENS